MKKDGKSRKGRRNEAVNVADYLESDGWIKCVAGMPRRTDDVEDERGGE